MDPSRDDAGELATSLATTTAGAEKVLLRWTEMSEETNSAMPVRLKSTVSGFLVGIVVGLAISNVMYILFFPFIYKFYFSLYENIFYFK